MAGSHINANFNLILKGQTLTGREKKKKINKI